MTGTTERRGAIGCSKVCNVRASSASSHPSALSPPFPMKIAIVGSGVSGLSATWLLNEYSDHEVHLYEADDRPGGHANTVMFAPPGKKEGVYVDTGFIVFNPSTYPNFINFLELNKIRILPTEMTFSVSRDRGAFEWAGDTIFTVFCQPWRLVDPDMWRLLYDVLRFNACARSILRDDFPAETSIGEYLDKEGYSMSFKDNYLIPMTACIWSTPPEKCALDFPAKTLVSYDDKVTGKPSWLTLDGGSRVYVNRILSKLPQHQLHLSTPIRAVSTFPERDTVDLVTSAGVTETYDHVIFACHSDTALSILQAGEGLTAEEEAILGKFQWNQNEAVLHCDTNVRAHAGASELDDHGVRKANSDQVSLTYGMNALQHIPESKFGPVLVTLNPPFEPRKGTTGGRWRYDHPVLDGSAVQAQKLVPRIQRTRGLSYAGAYLRYGFHEDGFASGLAAARHFVDRNRLPFELELEVDRPAPDAKVAEMIFGEDLSFLLPVPHMPSVRVRRSTYVAVEPIPPRPLTEIFKPPSETGVPIAGSDSTSPPPTRPSPRSSRVQSHVMGSTRSRVLSSNFRAASPESLGRSATPLSHHSGVNTDVVVRARSDGEPGLIGSALSVSDAESQRPGLGRDDSDQDLDDHVDQVVEHLDVIDPQVATVSTLTNAANAILFPPWHSHKPVVTLSSPSISEVTDPEDGQRPGKEYEDSLDRHVQDVLKKPSKFRRTMKGVLAFLKTPLGVSCAILSPGPTNQSRSLDDNWSLWLLLFWGAAIVIFLVKIINFHNANTQGFWVEVSSQVENGEIVHCHRNRIDTLTRSGHLQYAAPLSSKVIYAESNSGVFWIWHYKRKTRRLRLKAGLPVLFDEDDLPDPAYDPNYVHVLTDEEQKYLHRHELEQVKFQRHQTWYRAHGTETHRAFPINTALLICCLNDGNSIFQIILCGTMWGLDRFQRPAWSTGILIPASFLCGIFSAVFIAIGGNHTKRVEKVRERLAAALAMDHPADLNTDASNLERGAEKVPDHYANGNGHSPLEEELVADERMVVPAVDEKGHPAFLPPQHFQPQYYQPQPSPPPPPVYNPDPASFRRDYSRHLAELKVNSRPIIQNLSVIAQDFTRYAEIIVQCIESHIRQVPHWMKLPAFYLLDAISKNVFDPYARHFSGIVVSLFLDTHSSVDEVTRGKMEEMLITWRTGSPTGAPLFGEPAQAAIERGIWQKGNAEVFKAQVLTELEFTLSQKERASHANPYDTTSQNHIVILQQLRRLIETGVSYPELEQILAQLRSLMRPVPVPQPPPQPQQAWPAPPSHTPTPVYNNAPAQPPPFGYSGSFAKSEPPPASSSTAATLISQDSILNLLTTLKKQGFGGDKTDDTPEQQAPDLDRDASRAYRDAILLRGVRLTSTDVTRKRTDVAEFLYDRMALQCRQCGVRFSDTAAGKQRMEEHLDMHFQQNRRANQNIGRGHARSWFDWISDVSDVKGKGRADGARPRGLSAKAAMAAEEAKRIADLRAQYVVVPPGEEAVSLACPICKETFKNEWNDEEEEWVWRNAVSKADRVGAGLFLRVHELNGPERKVYHATCHAEATNGLALRLKSELASFGSDSKPLLVGIKRKAEESELDANGAGLHSEGTPPLKKLALAIES
ncbi:unnamed protein product [Mycena citricolor]|uniref:CID domain-containing protein n=1 Tax=Mycena citricolor TaxID=2018698 RepID=A0AAD2GUU1_9AGAR|nr:unnamed protein product [Mycena citricolor]